MALIITATIMVIPFVLVLQARYNVYPYAPGLRQDWLYGQERGDPMVSQGK